MRRFLSWLALLPAAGMALAQQSAPTPAPFTQSVDVVATTPVDAWGVPRDQVPSGVQSLGAAELGRGGVAAAMERRLPGVQLEEGQGSSWQPDLQFRGFSASPLLGIPQGLAVYQDGVRLNDPFGDTVRWDLVPTAAIARLDLVPGSNPLFGLNALGGALLMETKNGFSDPGLRGALTAGSFGRRGLEADWGRAHAGSALFLSLDHQEDTGWRDFSPSRTDQLFGSLTWSAGGSGSGALSVSAAGNRLSGNGPSPVPLLDQDRGAVFTYPDRSEPRSLLLSGRLFRSPSPRLDAEAHAYYRRQGLDTLNGDAASFAPCQTPGDEPWLCREGETAPLRGLDGRLLPAGLAADAVENRATTDQRSAGGGLQISWHAGEGPRTSRTVFGLTADTGLAGYRSGTELAALAPDRGTEGLGVFLLDDRVHVESRTSTLALALLEAVTLDARTTLDLAARWQGLDERLRDRLGTALDGDHSFRALAPSVGLTRALSPGWVLFGNLGISSRVPTPVELTCADADAPCRLPNAFLSDPPLRQVVTRTLELGTRGSWRSLRLSAALFQADSRDDILFISSGRLTGSGYFANVGRTRRQGADLLAQGALPRGASWSMAYSYLDATFQTSFSAPAPNHPEAVDGEIPVRAGDRLPLLPRQTFKAGVELPVGAARIETHLLYESARYLQGDEANLLKPLPGFFRLDLDLTHPLGRRLTGFLQVENLLNRKYATFGLLGDPGGVLGEDVTDPRFLSPADPRTFRMGVRFLLSPALRAPGGAGRDRV
jgi:iron complex outermembrane recepter protein